MYVRLLSASPPGNADHALQTFQRYLGQLRRWHGDTLPARDVDDAFAVIWQGFIPAENECVKLLEVLLAEAVNDSDIPLKIANFITSIPLKELTPQQKQIVQALSRKPFIDEFVNHSKPMMEAYIYAVDLETCFAQGKVEAKSVQFVLDFLRKHKRNLHAERTQLYEIITACLVVVSSPPSESAPGGPAHDWRACPREHG